MSDITAPLVRDLREKTQTRLIVREIEIGAKIPNRRFRLATLDSAR